MAVSARSTSGFQRTRQSKRTLFSDARRILRGRIIENVPRMTPTHMPRDWKKTESLSTCRILRSSVGLRQTNLLSQASLHPSSLITVSWNEPAQRFASIHERTSGWIILDWIFCSKHVIASPRCASARDTLKDKSLAQVVCESSSVPDLLLHCCWIVNFSSIVQSQSKKVNEVVINILTTS